LHFVFRGVRPDDGLARSDMDRLGLLSMAMVLGLGISAAACAGPDAGVISFSEAGFTADEDEEEDDSATKTKSTPSTSAAATLFAKDVYPTLKQSCGSCHAQGNTVNAPVFFGKDAASTYTMFKQNDYHRPNSGLVTKGAHAGPELNAEQKAAIQKWVAAEGGKK
jgi:mono/diheme cytochrome c family protein